MVDVCSQTWRDIKEEAAVAVNKCCHDDGLRKQHLGYHNSWDVGVSYCCMVLGIVLWWCWQCLLTVGGNWLQHTVTPLDVTTVAWCCRQTQDVLHPAEWPPASLQTSHWQWTALVFTTWHCTGRCSCLFTEGWCLQQYLILWFGCLIGVTNKRNTWHCTS